MRAVFKCFFIIFIFVFLLQNIKAKNSILFNLDKIISEIQTIKKESKENSIYKIYFKKFQLKKIFTRVINDQTSNTPQTLIVPSAIPIHLDNFSIV